MGVDIRIEVLERGYSLRGSIREFEGGSENMLCLVV